MGQAGVAENTAASDEGGHDIAQRDRDLIEAREKAQ
jgi:hypothetical protein